MKNLTLKKYIETCRDDIAITTDEELLNMDIVMVVEVPHQRKARSYYYYGKEEYERLYLSSVEEDADKGGGIDHPEGFWSAEAVEAYAGNDLHNWRKLVGIDEILSFVPVDHQRLEVWRSITLNLLSLGVAEEITDAIGD